MSAAPQTAAAPRAAPTADLTICAVTFGDRPLLELNRELTERLNDVRPAWRLVRNRPLRAEDADGREDMPFETVEGAELPPELRGLSKSGSHHHALGLAVASAGIATRYLVYLDPDCFVVRRGWIDDVLEHMDRSGLAFFGTPYHPRATRRDNPSHKFRYFPCSVFLAVDTRLVDVARLDWTPELALPDASANGRLERALIAYLRRSGCEFRLESEIAQDTGIRVYVEHREVSPAECVQPAMRPDHLTHRITSPKQRVFEKLLPDRYCVVPKRRGFLTDEGFAAHGYADTGAMGCEEYMWRGEPFALHLRGAPELAADHGAVREVIAQFG